MKWDFCKLDPYHFRGALKCDSYQTSADVSLSGPLILDFQVSFVSLAEFNQNPNPCHC